MEEYARLFVEHYSATGQVINSGGIEPLIWFNKRAEYSRQCICRWILRRRLFNCIAVRSHRDTTSHCNRFSRPTMTRSCSQLGHHRPNAVDLTMAVQVIQRRPNDVPALAPCAPSWITSNICPRVLRCPMMRVCARRDHLSTLG